MHLLYLTTRSSHIFDPTTRFYDLAHRSAFCMHRTKPTNRNGSTLNYRYFFFVGRNKLTCIDGSNWRFPLLDGYDAVAFNGDALDRRLSIQIASGTCRLLVLCNYPIRMCSCWRWVFLVWFFCRNWRRVRISCAVWFWFICAVSLSFINMENIVIFWE